MKQSIIADDVKERYTDVEREILNLFIRERQVLKAKCLSPAQRTPCFLDQFNLKR